MTEGSFQLDLDLELIAERSGFEPERGEAGHIFVERLFEGVGKKNASFNAIAVLQYHDQVFHGKEKRLDAQ